MSSMLSPSAADAPADAAILAADAPADTTPAADAPANATSAASASVLATTPLILNLIHTPTHHSSFRLGSLPYLLIYHYLCHFPLRDGLFSFFYTYLLRTLHSPTNGRYPQPNLQSWACAKGGFRSKRRPTLVRMAAAWGSGITGSGLSSPFPLLRPTQPHSGRAENFEANTHPYRIPPLLSSHTHLPPHLSSTGVF